MALRSIFSKGILTIACVAVFVSVVFLTGIARGTHAKDKDKTPPVISGLHAESITDTSAVIAWTTDEPADGSIKYGIAPQTNINGPDDPTLVLSHAIALSGLIAQTTYAYCVTSRDADNNKTDACDTFTTTAFPAGGAEEEGTAPMRALISGFAYPGAHITVSLKEIPRGDTFEETAVASNSGSFYLSLEDFPSGLYSFFITAVDQENIPSVRKGIQFEFRRKTSPLYLTKVILPPTIEIEREVVALGDDIAVSGSATPHTGVLIEAGGVWYETKTDSKGAYRVLINTARFAPGKLTLRARSTLISEFGNDYSYSKTVTVSATSVPKADINADGVVDIKDFSIFLTHPTDLNGDDKVNASDVSIFLRAFKLPFL